MGVLLLPVNGVHIVISVRCASVAWIVERALELGQDDRSLAERQALLQKWDENGPMATPANSRFNELVIEAARLSIVNRGRPYGIQHGKNPHVEQA